MMGYHDLSAAGGPRVSTQDRATREGGEGGHSSEHDGGDAVAGADVAGSQTLRMRAMQRRWIQRKAARADGGGGGGAAAIPGGTGAQLGGDVQKRMERTLGADLSGVRVHTGGDSAEAADSMGARAFTVGGDVHFNRGEFAPGSKEGDRLLAHELTHVVQGQKSGVQRKAAEHGDADGADGDHEAGGHEVSEPGDPAEHEADAMGDHAAEQLHGGGDKGGGEHGADAKGGEHGGGKKVAREKPAVGAAAPSVGRKIFRAPKPGAQPAKPAAQPAAAAGAGASTKPGAPGAKDAKAQPKPIAPAVAARMQAISKNLDKDVNDRAAAVTVKSAGADVDQFAKDYPDDASVKELKDKLTAKQAAMEARFQEVMKTATAAVAKIDASKPSSWPAIDAMMKDAAVLNWVGHPLFPATHELTQAFIKARDGKASEFADNKQKALDKARQEIKAAPDKTESRAVIQAILDGAKPYIADASPYHGAVVVQMQEAFAAKIESIGSAEKVEKEKQDKLAAEQKEKASHPQAAVGAGKGPADGKGPDAKPAAAAAPAAAVSATPPPAATVTPKPPVAGAPPAPAPQAEKKQDAPAAGGAQKPAAASATTAAPAATPATVSAAPAAPHATAAVETPKPAGAPPPATDHAKPADASAASAAGKDAKPADAAQAHAPAPASSTDAAPTGAKPADAAAPTGEKKPELAKGHDGAPPGGEHGAEPEDPAVKELELKKELAKARVLEYAAKIKGRTTILSGAMEIGNALMTVAKVFGAGLHGIEIPEEALSMGKDGIQAFLKMEGLSVEVVAAMGEAEIDSAESVAEIDALFDTAEFLYHEHVMILSRAEAMFKAAERCFKARVEQAAKAGEAGGGAEKKEEKAHAPEGHGAAPHEAHGEDGEEKKDDKKDQPGLGAQFQGVMAASDAQENADIGGYKMEVNNAAVVMDPLKALAAGLEIRTELKSMAQAKRDVRAAEEALKEHLKANGGTPLPEQKK
jgi:hypothetical protein